MAPNHMLSPWGMLVRCTRSLLKQVNSRIHHRFAFYTTHKGYYAYTRAQFTSVEISVPYSHGVNNENRTYAVYCRPAMGAILDTIEDPDLRPSFIFYPEWHYVLNPHTHKLMRVWSDIHTADDWWMLQVCFHTP